MELYRISRERQNRLIEALVRTIAGAFGAEIGPMGSESSSPKAQPNIVIDEDTGRVYPAKITDENAVKKLPIGLGYSKLDDKE